MGKTLPEQISIQLGDQASPVTLETSPISREKQQTLRRLSQPPHCPSAGVKQGTCVILPLPSHPCTCHVSNRALLLSLASSTIRFRVWGPPRLVFPQFLMIQIPISVLIKQKKKLISVPHLKAIQPIFKESQVLLRHSNVRKLLI